MISVTECSKCGGGTNNFSGPCVCAALTLQDRLDALKEANPQLEDLVITLGKTTDSHTKPEHYTVAQPLEGMVRNFIRDTK